MASTTGMSVGVGVDASVDVAVRAGGLVAVLVIVGSNEGAEVWIEGVLGALP